MNQPDHNSLWRFWRANREVIRQVYRQTVQLAMRAGLVSLALMAVDGTKIQAVASGRTGWSKQQMKDVLARLDESLKDREQAIEANQQLEGGEYRLPESLTERQALKETIQKGLAELAQTERKHYHPEEPEAHRMKCGGQNLYAYNAQAVAEEKSGIILACAVTDKENDTGQLPLMLQQAKEVVEACQPAVSAPQAETPSEVAEAQPSPAQDNPFQAVADTGYGAGADLAAARAAGFDVVTPLPEGKPSAGNPYHASRFSYDPQTEVCRCPQGQELAFERRKDRRGTPVKIYRCHCKDCPVRGLCTRDRRGRMIEIAEHHPEVLAMRQKLGSPEGRARLAQRGRIIEPRFAEVKVGQAFRRWTVRGLQNVTAQWHWVCATVNLKVLFRKWACGQFQFS